MVLGDGLKVRNLCRQIEEEKDPHKFRELMRRLNDLLDENPVASEESEKKEEK